ncbi:ribosomal protein 63, mitochondrial [Pseudomyrmex gracilis]|uniref:ribosomal protein 63, mitochondrial n=1 Tax=Pseudomyrmex gracilis TaxID=219809 RepID=UPI000994F086|nr:ribosomal protein 63, mitochondrial [Pseudomyrmex gracilis]
MQLTQILCRFTNKLPYRFRGKYRIVKKPSMKDLLQMRQDFEREEKNMLILRHPYLTIEQEKSHMSHVNRKSNFLELKYNERNEKFEKQYTIAEQLRHLRITEGWD